MTELEQLRADLATLEKAKEVAATLDGGFSDFRFRTLIDSLKQKIADLEAQQEQADEWADAKAILNRWCFDRNLSGESYRVFIYVCHLQAKVAELDHELRCERIDGGKVRDDRKAEISELKAKTEREQLELCKECSHPLSDCGPPSVDGTPTTDCKVCQLKAQIAEMEQHGRKVDQANHEHYGRLQDQIAIRDLKIEKLERQAPAERSRETLAELTTIMNAIPPVCATARELVEKWILQVKKEMQGNV